MRTGKQIFIRSSKFELIQSIAKSLLELFSEVLKEKDNVSFGAWNYVKRPDVTILSHFRSRESKNEILVANVHISFADYRLRDLQALQTATVMNALMKMAKEKGENEFYLPHIICGDLNQQPGSPGYRLLELGNLPQESVAELQEKHKHIVSFKENGEKVQTGLYHLLGQRYFCHASDSLKSAYFEGLKGKEPHVTCIDLRQNNPKQTLDYIWYSCNGLDLLKIVDVPAEINDEIAFPSQEFPSDHLSLCASFAFKESHKVL
jgi:mRNA deadenylase 3'-5' endonuclease subunit Ccr4